MKNRFFLPFIVIVLSGCTNVVGDAPRAVTPLPGKSLSDTYMATKAETFFKSAGYTCDVNKAHGQLRCARELRNIHVHQTRAVVTIYVDEDRRDAYRILASRWDEGLIPGELIASEYANPDVVAFCDALAADRVAVCHVPGGDDASMAR